MAFFRLNSSDCCKHGVLVFVSTTLVGRDLGFNARETQHNTKEPTQKEGRGTLIALIALGDPSMEYSVRGC